LGSSDVNRRASSLSAAMNPPLDEVRAQLPLAPQPLLPNDNAGWNNPNELAVPRNISSVDRLQRRPARKAI
jgi:hypothetical protein